MKSLGLLAAGTILAWAALLYPAWHLQGDLALVQCTAAMGLSLVPALLTAAWLLYGAPGPEMQLVAILGGNGVRLVVVLCGGLVLHATLPESFTENSWIGWLGFFYLYTLALETVLVLRHKGRVTG